MVRLLRCLPALLPVLAGAACNTTSHVADLAQNELFYVDVPFTTKSPGDRAVCVLPMADARVATGLPTSERGFPITYSGDDFWDRPIAAMAGDVLQRQVEKSGLFAAAATTAQPDAVLLVPSLVTWLGGTTEAISGGISFADVGVRVQVFGPAPAGGERPLWHDEVYGNRQVSQLELNPPSPYRLVGRALQFTMTKLLAGLDGSQVARSGVPIVRSPNGAAEAAAPAR